MKIALDLSKNGVFYHSRAMIIVPGDEDNEYISICQYVGENKKEVVRKTMKSIEKVLKAEE